MDLREYLLIVGESLLDLSLRKIQRGYLIRRTPPDFREIPHGVGEALVQFILRCGQRRFLLAENPLRLSQLLLRLRQPPLDFRLFSNDGSVGIIRRAPRLIHRTHHALQRGMLLRKRSVLLARSPLRLAEQPFGLRKLPLDVSLLRCEDTVCLLRHAAGFIERLRDALQLPVQCVMLRGKRGVLLACH